MQHPCESRRFLGDLIRVSFTGVGPPAGRLPNKNLFVESDKAFNVIGDQCYTCTAQTIQFSETLFFCRRKRRRLGEREACSSCLHGPTIFSPASRPLPQILAEVNCVPHHSKTFMDLSRPR